MVNWYHFPIAGDERGVGIMAGFFEGVRKVT
jgi:hypothetical protein